MKVAVVTGICVERDAISAAAANQAELLAAMDDVEDVVLIAHAHERKTSVRQVTVGTAWELITLADVAEVDLIIFHWGIRYDLFNALAVLAPRVPTVVHFHNLTPPELVSADDVAVIEESTRQMMLPFLTGSRLWTVSPFNTQTLKKWGYDDEAISFVPFPIEPLGPRPTQDDREPGPVRLLTVGRLVRAKGLDVLIDAFDMATLRADAPLSLRITGSAQLSGDAFVDELRQKIRSKRLESSVRIELDLPDDELWAEYLSADILVVPSLHEGLCVPVIEGYMAGCRVIGTDAGNLPNVVQAPDPVVPAGDAEPLADAIVAVANEIAAGTSVQPDGAAQIIATYSTSNVVGRLQAAISGLFVR